MHSVRSFLRLWAFITFAILAYALVDLSMHPWLKHEQNFTMQPDFRRVGELVHWGGRLLKEHAHGLLVANALVIGGLVALVIQGLTKAIRSIRSDASNEVTLEARLSEPPG